MLLPLFECVHKSNIFTATDTTHPYEGDRWSNLLKKKNTHFCQKKRKKEKNYLVNKQKSSLCCLWAQEDQGLEPKDFSAAGWWIVNPLINSSPRCCGEFIMRAKQQLLWSYRVVGLDHWECNASILSRSVHLSKSPGFPLRIMMMMMMKMKRRLIGFLWQLFKLRSSFLHSLFLCHLHQILPGGNTLFGLRWKDFLSNNNYFFLFPQKE